MGCGNLFSTTQKQSNQSTESGTANTSNNLWDDPGVQSFFQQYQDQYSPSNIASVNAPVNSWQNGALSSQAGLAPYASQIGAQGISTTDVQRFMDPYIQSVVNPTIQAQNLQNQQGISNLNGNSALKIALGNNTGQGAAYLAGVQPAQQAQIASLYSQGFGQAANLAGQSTNAQLAGINAGTSANQGQFNMGETARQASLQNQLTPYSLQSQGIEGYTGLGGLAGTNTATSGQSSGTSTGTSTPGLGTVAAGLLGSALSGGLFGKLATGGAVKSMPSEGKEDDFHGKVMKAFHMIQGMKEHARGGMVHRDIGGGVGDVGLGSWAPVVTKEPEGPTTAQKFGSALTDFSHKLGQAPQGDGGLGQQQSALSQMLSGAASSTMPRPMRPYGGAVDAGLPGSPSGEAVYGGEYDFRPFYNSVGSMWDKLKGFGSRQMQAVNEYEGSAPMKPYAPSGPATAAEVPPILRSREAPPQVAASEDDPSMFSPSVQFGDIDAQSPMAVADAPTPEHETLPWGLGASDVPPPAARPTASAAPASSGSSWKDYLPSIASDGVWVGDAPTRAQRLGAALMQVGQDNPFAKAGQMIMGYAGDKAKTDTLQSEALKAAHDANLEYQIKSAQAMGDVKREQSLKNLQMMKGFADNMHTPLGSLLHMNDPDAFQGQDGNWYKPDPTNPGKYLMAKPRSTSSEASP